MKTLWGHFCHSKQVIPPLYIADTSEHPNSQGYWQGTNVATQELGVDERLMYWKELCTNKFLKVKKKKKKKN